MSNYDNGKTYEELADTALKLRKDYTWSSQVFVGQGPDTRTHRIDYVGIHNKSNEKIGVSVKGQDTSGTTFEKLYYELAKLTHLLKTDPTFKKVYLMIEGKEFGKGSAKKHAEWIRYKAKDWVVGFDPSKLIIVNASEFIALPSLT